MKHSLTCPACGHQIHATDVGQQDWQFCPSCGCSLPELPEPSTAQVSGNKQATPQFSNPPLWNPIIITLLGVPLGYLFSSVLAAINWHVLRKHWAAASTWVFAVFFAAFVQAPLLELWAWPWPYLVGGIVWFPFVGLTQLLYFRTRPYPKRGWLLPIAIGIAVQLILLIWTAVDQRRPGVKPPGIVPSESAKETDILSTDQIAAAYQGRVFQVRLRWKERGGFLWLSLVDEELRGSAVLIANSNDTGLLVTNRHVVTPTTDNFRELHCEVRVADNVEFASARVVANGRGQIDLALLSVTLANGWQPNVMRTMRLSQLRIGESCVAMGNALGNGTSVTQGVVSRADELNGLSLIRTSAPVSHGNSGGALFLSRGGFLVGIVTASVEQGQNFNLAIPVDYLLSRDTWDFSGDESPAIEFLNEVLRNTEPESAKP